MLTCFLTVLVHRYSYLSSCQIKQIPVPALAAPNCLVVTWVTNRQKHLHFVKDELYPHWSVKTVAEWHWVKVSSQFVLLLSWRLRGLALWHFILWFVCLLPLAFIFEKYGIISIFLMIKEKYLKEMDTKIFHCLFLIPLWQITGAGEFVFPLDSLHKKPYEVLVLGRVQGDVKETLRYARIFMVNVFFEAARIFLIRISVCLSVYLSHLFIIQCNVPKSSLASSLWN